MPTYYARGVTISLGAQPLVDTITPKIVLKKGETAKSQCEEAEKQLLGSGLLHEKRVNFPNDEAGFELNWLGGAPFMQVRTSESLFEGAGGQSSRSSPSTINPAQLWQSTPNTSNHGSRIPSSDDALALSLHVKLSEKTFMSGLDKANKLHLKIDVFFNGKLSSCLFVPFHDVRSKAKSYHQVFAGHRVDYLAERPWVIVSPHKAGLTGSSASEKCLPLSKRWDDVCGALATEADARGKDKHGNISPTAEFLKALATMQMPSEVQSMQPSKKQTFGVIDVVITAGDGKKVSFSSFDFVENQAKRLPPRQLTSGKSYLKAPQRLIDESYPIWPISKDQEDFEPPDQNEALTRPALGLTRDEYGDADDSEFEPPAKRRALPSRMLTVSSKSDARTSIRSRSRAQSVQMTSVKVPNTSSTMSSTLANQYVAHHSVSSPEHVQAQQSSYTGYNYGDSDGNPKTFHSFSRSNVGHMQTPQMLPSPYSYQSSASLLGLESPSMPTTFATPGKPSSWSSPLPQLPQSYGTALPMALPQMLRGPGFLNDVRGSVSAGTTASLPAQLRRGSTSSIADSHLTSSTPFGDQQTPSHVLQPCANLQSPVSQPNMLPVPLTFDSYGRQSLRGLPPLSSPFDRRFSMPLPPMGMFSVPTKPNVSRPPSKSSRSTSPARKQVNLRITRLVITGLNGVTVVDHRWSTTQVVALDKNPGMTHSSDASPLSSLNSSMLSTTSSGVSLTKRSPTKITTLERTPIPVSEPQPPLSAPVASLSVKAQLNAPELEGDSKSRIVNAMDSAEIHAPPLRPTAMAARAATEPALPQRRVSANNNILGVQGPKATTFWLEDPEEVLREAARLRRAKAPLKPKKDSVIAVEHNTIAGVKKAAEACVIGSSSPLSTAPSSPEIGHGRELCESRSISITSPTESADAIPQLDGARDRKSVKPKLSNARTPSPAKKVTATATSRLPPMTPSTPQTSPSSASKKRKATTRYLPKLPRSPDRLKTAGNPPLNRGCVIAFAESVDDDEGVLRQVKGERQGVFKEEYVVLATRFFIPGA